MTFKLIVCGGRNFAHINGALVGDELVAARKQATADQQLLHSTMEYFNTCYGPITTLGHGVANGADKVAGAWAKGNNIPVQEFPVTAEEWKTLGKKAGVLRNLAMLDAFQPNAVIAFPGGPGTEHMCQEAKRRKVWLFRISNDLTQVIK